MDPDLWRGFRQDQVRRNLSETTIAGRRGRLRLFSDHLGDKPITEATSEDVEQWLDARGVTARTRSVYVSSLHAFYEWARRAGHVTVPPTLDVIRPRVGRLTPHPISPGDFLMAVENASQKMRCWLTLGAFEGFRCKEIAGLRCEDVMLDRDPPMLRINEGKGGHEDTMPLNRTAERELLAYGIHGRRGPVFVSPTGRGTTANSVSTLGNRYLHSLGIDATMHDLRHAFVSWVYGETHDLRLAQELARHADPRTTAGYAALMDERTVAVVRDLAPPLRFSQPDLFSDGSAGAAVPGQPLEHVRSPAGRG